MRCRADPLNPPHTLNEHWFSSLDDARCKIDEWRGFYKEVRPHCAIAWKTPAEFARFGDKCPRRRAIDLLGSSFNSRSRRQNASY